MGKFLFNVKKFERLSNDSNVSPGMFLVHVFLCFPKASCEFLVNWRIEVKFLSIGGPANLFHDDPY